MASQPEHVSSAATKCLLFPARLTIANVTRWTVHRAK